MTTKILVEFDPKDASPLEVINHLNELMEQNLEEGKISDYSLAEQHVDEDMTHFSGHTLVARRSDSAPQQTQTPPQENPT